MVDTTGEFEMIFHSILIIIALLVSACANVNVSPPQQNEIEKTRQFAVPFETAWSRAVDWFANNNITIEKIEKPSGLITAKYSILVDHHILNCGQINMTGILGEPKIERFGTFNVTVREVDPSTSRATANFFGEFRAVGLDAWDARQVVAEGRCNSTGVIERQFFDSISGKQPKG